MGSGEGAQVFGWGTYFTDNRGIAEGYKNANVRKHGITASFKEGSADEFEWLNKHFSDVPDGVLLQKDVEQVLDLLLKGNRQEVELALETAQRAADRWRKLGGSPLKGDNYATGKIASEQTKADIFKKYLEDTEAPGKLYEVELPDDAKWLDWDKPVTDPDLINIFEEAGIRDLEREFNDQELLRKFFRGDTGEDLYQALVEELGSPKAASQYLASKGVAGNRYLATFGS